MFYKLNNTIHEMPDDLAKQSITIKTIGEVEATTSTGEKHLTQGVIEKDVLYIETITDIYTTEAMPTYDKEKEKVELIKNDKGKGEWVKRTLTDEELVEIKKNKIAELKQYLADTDYTAIKKGEGVIKEGEYEEIFSAREDARAEINKLEAEIEKLKEKS